MARIETAVQELGVTITFTTDLPNDWLGAYRHRTNSILLRPGMDWPTFRSVFAHELGHAYYGHEHTADKCTNWRQEQLADAYAAQLLLGDGAHPDRLGLVGTAKALAAGAMAVLPWVLDAISVDVLT
jgi:Zn-dependent peptidase ImmA (M78 family)